MQHSKYFIEGMAAAHNGSIRVTRYQRPENVEQWLAGYDSVDPSHALFKILPGVGEIGMNDLDPVYLGTAKECSDRLVTIKQTDRTGNYVVYDMATGKPYQEETKLNYKKI